MIKLSKVIKEDASMVEAAMYVCVSSDVAKELTHAVAPRALLARAAGNLNDVLEVGAAAPCTALVLAQADKHNLMTVCCALNAFGALIGANVCEWSHTSEAAQKSARRVASVLVPLTTLYADYHDNDPASMVYDELMSPFQDDQIYEREHRDVTRHNNVARSLRRRRSVVESKSSEIKIVERAHRGIYNAFSALLGSKRFDVLMRKEFMPLLKAACVGDETLVAHLERVEAAIEESAADKELPLWFRSTLDFSTGSHAGNESRRAFEKDCIDTCPRVVQCPCGSANSGECAGLALRAPNEKELLCCLCTVATNAKLDAEAIECWVPTATVVDGILVGVCTHCRTFLPFPTLSDANEPTTNALRKVRDVERVDWSKQVVISLGGGKVEFVALLEALLAFAEREPSEAKSVATCCDMLSLRFREWQLPPFMPNFSLVQALGANKHYLSSAANAKGTIDYSAYLVSLMVARKTRTLSESRVELLQKWLALGKRQVSGARVSKPAEQFLLRTTNAQCGAAKSAGVNFFGLATLMSALEMFTMMPPQPFFGLYAMIFEARNPSGTLEPSAELGISCAASERALRDLVVPFADADQLNAYVHNFLVDARQVMPFVEAPLARSTTLGGSLMSSCADDWRLDASERLDHALMRDGTPRPLLNTLALDDAFVNFYAK